MYPEDDEFENLEDEIEPGSSRRSLVVWLIVIGLAILFIPLYLVFNTLRADVTRMESELTPLQEKLAAEGTPPPELQLLREQVAAANSDVDAIAAVYPTLVASHIDWQPAMKTIANYDRTQMLLVDITQNIRKLTITGKAFDQSQVVAYARTLEESGLFSSVEIQSIVQIDEPIFTATPTISSTAAITLTTTPASVGGAAGGGGGSGGSSGGSGGGDDGSDSSGGSDGSGSGTGPSPTPTPDPRDEYEPDNDQAKPIYLGQIQDHNFYPNNDVDLVVFLAKANRFYEITTQSLAPGVDTVIEVTVGDTTIVNDDGKPGTLGSAVSFQSGGSDMDVRVLVRNRGQFGSEMSYQIVVNEMVPTATGTPAPSGTPTFTPSPPPTPTPTNTPTPSLTPTPSNTPPPPPTFTPVPGDQYEPNDTVPSDIGVGGTQTHTFDPAGDVDQVTFPVKNGRHYQIFSNNLAPGVDTFLTVSMNGQQWENDDYDPPGSGNLASAVCFSAAVDANPVATFTNIAGQYGADKTYDVVVQEVPELLVSDDQLDFGPVISGGADPPSQTLSLSSLELVTWTTRIEDSWISVNPITNSTPSSANISVDITGLTPGLYEGGVTFGWENLCTKFITVTLQVDPVASMSSDIASLFVPSTSGFAGETAVSHDFAAAKRPFLQQSGVAFIIIVELKESLPATP